jgi:predicted PurR-regulated permease PerM
MEIQGFRWRWFWLALLAFITLWLLWRLWQVLLPFILAGGVAYMLNPLIDRLETKGWSRNFSIVFVFVCLLGILVIAGSLIIPQVGTEIQGIVENYDPLLKKADTLYHSSLTWVQHHFPWTAKQGNRLPAQVRERAIEYGRGLLTKAPTILTSLLQSLAGLAFLVVLTLILTFWTLKEYHTIGKRLLAFIPRSQQETVISLTHKINHLVSAYLVGQIILGIIAGILATAILLAFHVNYAILIGILAGALYLIPYFGIPTTMILSVILSAVSGNSLPSILGMIGCLIALNLILDYGITPRIIGNRVQLHPMTILFAVIAVGELLGFAGVLIAVPLAAAVKAVLVEFFPEFFASRQPTSVSAGASAVIEQLVMPEQSPPSDESTTSNQKKTKHKDRKFWKKRP